MVTKFNDGHLERDPVTIVNAFCEWAFNNHALQQLNGKIRKTTFVGSASDYIGKFRKALLAQGEPTEWCSHLRIRNRTVHKKKKNPRCSFVKQQLERYKSIDAKSVNPSTVVDEFSAWAKTRFDMDKARGTKRKITHLSSAQTALSTFKREMTTFGTCDKWCSQLKLQPSDTRTLKAARVSNVITASTGLPLIDAELVVIRCRSTVVLSLYSSQDQIDVVIALCALTGRRSSEILLTATFSAPKTTHTLNPPSWAHVSGLLKKGKLDDEGIDIPIFATLDCIKRAVASIRLQFPCACIKDANSKYAYRIASRMKHMFPIISKVHNMRKLYGMLCHRYFNEKNQSLPGCVSSVLGHSSMSSVVLTYLGGFSYTIPTIGRRRCMIGDHVNNKPLSRRHSL